MFKASNDRYSKMPYNKCGKSGLKLPALSLGLWHNFGTESNMENNYSLITKAFDNGITHFDLANNYGPIAGSAESNFGDILYNNLKGYRDEMIISTKAGYYMWEGPYGEFGSKKYLAASLDQSLKRLKVDYVDIFYHHRPCNDTPIEEVAHTLDLMVRQGKALYVGVSNYPADMTKAIYNELKKLNTPFIIHQPCYNIFNRGIEKELVQVLEENEIGCIAFSPLAQGVLTNRYLKGIPSDSRAEKNAFLKKDYVKSTIEKVKALNEVAKERGQTIAQLAISWLLSKPYIISALIGASKVSQLEENINSIKAPKLSNEELLKIDLICQNNV